MRIRKDTRPWYYWPRYVAFHFLLGIGFIFELAEEIYYAFGRAMFMAASVRRDALEEWDKPK